MHRSTLIHFVDDQELVAAQQHYLPSAQQGVTPENAGLENPEILRHSSLLRATVPHHYKSPLSLSIEEVSRNIHSFEYYKTRFMKFLADGFHSKNKQRAVFELVERALAEMPAPVSLRAGIQELCAVVDQFLAAHQKVIDEIYARLTLSEKRDSPKTVFFNDGLTEAIRGLFRRTKDDTLLMYRQQIKEVCGTLHDWKNAYMQNLDVMGHDADALTEVDKAEYMKMARSLLVKETKAFADKCAAMKATIINEYDYMHSVKKIKEMALDKVALAGGKNSNVITAEIENLPPENENVDEFLNRVQTIIVNAEMESDGLQTVAQYYNYFPVRKAGEKTVLQDLRDQALSPNMIHFLLRYLNRDHLAGITHYHRTELSHYFNIPENSLISNLRIERTNDGVLLHIEERYRDLQVKSDAQVKTHLRPQADVAKSVTTLRIREYEHAPMEITVERSELNLYDNALRAHYLSQKIYAENGILTKMIAGKKLLKNDHAIVDIFTEPYRRNENWHTILKDLEDKSADEIFVACWRDEFIMTHLFEPGYFKTTLTDGHEDARQPHLVERQNHVLQRFCQVANPLQRIEALQNKYRYYDLGVNRPIVVTDNLKHYLQLVQERNWKEIAKLLNHVDSRDLMMAAMHSLTDEKAIKNALSISTIRYSLDANTLTRFALQYESAANKVLKQSVWQRLGIKISRLFSTGRYLNEPAKRLYQDQVSKIVKKHPQLWKTRLKERSSVYFSLTGHKNFRREMSRQELGEIWFNNPSAVSVKAADKAVFSDADLWSKLAAPLANQADADLKLRILAEHGFSYSDRISAKYGSLFNRGFIQAADQASDGAIEDFFFAQFKRMNDQENYVDLLKHTVTSVWNGQIDLPKRPNVLACVKRALLRAIRQRPDVYQLFDGVFGHVYHDLLSAIIDDDVILAAFMQHNDFLDDLRLRANDSLRMKILNKIKISTQLHHEGYEHHAQFDLKHLIAGYNLFAFDERVLHENQDVCQGVLDLLIDKCDEMIHFRCFAEISSGKMLSFLTNATSMQLATLLLRKNEFEAVLLQKLEQHPNLKANIDLQLQFYQTAVDAIMTNPVLCNKLLAVGTVLLQPVNQDFRKDNNQPANEARKSTLPWQNLMTLTNKRPELLEVLLAEDLLTQEMGAHLMQLGFRNLHPADISKIKAIPGMAVHIKRNDVKWRNWQDTLVKDQLVKARNPNAELLTPVIAKSVKSLMKCFKEIADPNQIMLEMAEIAKTCGMPMPNAKELHCSDELYHALREAAEQCGRKNINHLTAHFALERILNDYTFNSRLFRHKGFTAESAVSFYAAMTQLELSSSLLKTFTTNILSVACYDINLRQQILSSPLLQQYIGQYAQVDHLMLFLQTTSQHRTSVVGWHKGLERFMAEASASPEKMHQHCSFLLQHVDGFAGWALSHLARNPDVNIDEASLRLILAHRVRGADLLLLSRRSPEFHQMVRTILLDPSNSDLLKRTLEYQFDLDYEFSGAIPALPEHHQAHLLIDELNTLPIELRLMQALKADKIMCFMLTHANSAYLLKLFAQHPDTLALMVKLFTEHDAVRQKVLSNNALLDLVMQSAPDALLKEWVSAYERCSERLMDDHQMRQRYFHIANHDGRSELLLRAFNTGNQDAIDTYLPQVMHAFPKKISAHVILKLLRALINHAGAHREQLYKKILSHEFALAIVRADVNMLIDLYTNCRDPRAVNVLFFKHPLLHENLMARLWHSATAEQIIAMMNKNADPATPYNGKMLAVLLDYLNHDNPAHASRSAVYTEHLLELMQNPEFLERILAVATVTQLDRLLAANPAIAEKVMEYFKTHPEAFIASLKHGATYNLLLMSQLPDQRPENAMPGVIYIDEAKRTYLVYGLDGLLKRGNLPDEIDLNDLAVNLDNAKLKRKILTHTSKEGHTSGTGGETIKNFELRFHVRHSSQLQQLSKLFGNHSATRDLFTEHLRARPELFAELVIGNIHKSDDHAFALEIVEHCVKVMGSDFYVMFMRRGYNDPAMIFLLFSMAGGDAMRQLYNTGEQSADGREHLSHIATLSRLWEFFYGKETKNSSYQHFLAELRSPNLAGNHINLNILLRDENLQPGVDDFEDRDLRPRTQRILHKMIQVRTLLAEQMLSSGLLKRLLVNGHITRVEFDLFRNALSQPLKMAQFLFANSTPMQLVQLIDAESTDFDDFKPIRNLLLGHKASLERIVQDHKALAALLATRGFREQLPHSELLQDIVKTITESLRNVINRGKRYLKVSGKMDYQQCTIDQYRIYMAAQEFVEFSKIDGFNIANSHLYYDLFSLDQDNHVRTKGLPEHPSFNQLLEPKYLTCFYYSMYLMDSEEFVHQLEQSAVFRDAFCQLFEMNNDDQHPIKFALSGLQPPADLIMLYTYARAQQDRSFINPQWVDYLLNNAVVRRAGENYRFAGTFRYLPEKIQGFFADITSGMDPKHYQQIWTDKFDNHEHDTGRAIPRAAPPVEDNEVMEIYSY